MGNETSQSAQQSRSYGTPVGADNLLSHAQAHVSMDLSLADPLKYKSFRAGLGRVKNGTGQCKILHLGDSTSNGSGAGGSTGYGVNARIKNRTVKLASLINANLATANSHGLIGVANVSSTGYASFDPRFVPDAAWTTTVLNNCIGGTVWRNNSANTILAFTPSTAVDTFVIYYAKSATQGTFNVDIDGSGTILVTATAGSASVGTQVISGTLATHTLNITRQSTSAIILGVRAYNSAGEVEVIQAGSSGTTAGFLARDVNPWDTLNMIPVIAPDLTVICLGINDWTAGTSITAFTNAMQSMITSARTVGDVLLVTPPPSQVLTAVPIATQKLYVDALIALAALNSVDLVNIWKRLISYEDAQPYGFYADNLHPNGVGYSDWAFAEFARLNSL